MGKNATTLKGKSYLFRSKGISNIELSSDPKGVCQGYMDYVSWISEDVVRSLEHLPPDLCLTIARHGMNT